MLGLITAVARRPDQGPGRGRVPEGVALLRRDGHEVATLHVERLMRRAGCAGQPWPHLEDDRARHPAATRPADLVKRDFTARGPEPAVGGRLHPRADLGRVCFTAFVTDVYSRRIVGWRTREPDAHRAAPGRPGDGAVGALPPRARRHRSGPPLRRPVAVHPPSANADRLADAAPLPRSGTVGDSYDNAMAESAIGLHKTECVRRDGPFRTVEDLD